MNTDRGSRTTGCEIFAALLKEGRTQAQLSQACGVSKGAIQDWLKEMRLSGLVYRRKAAHQIGQVGKCQIVYHIQPKPFQIEDWQETEQPKGKQ